MDVSTLAVYCSSRSRTGDVSYTHMRYWRSEGKQSTAQELTYTMNNQSYICLT